MAQHHPPKYYHRFLKWFCHPALYEELEGDLMERFILELEENGLRSAKQQYKKEVIRLFRPSVIRPLSLNIVKINPAMIRNYLKVALRNLWKYKDSSLINIAGLTIGLCGGLLITVFIQDELQFDKHHPDVDQLFRVYTEVKMESGDQTLANTSPTLGPTFKEEFPEIIDALRLYSIRSKQLFKYENREYLEQKGFFAEASIMDFFDLPVISGDPQASLQQPGQIVLCESTAKKYFGEENPVGKNLEINGRSTQVGAVIADPQRHFHLDFDFLFSFATINELTTPERMKSWIWQDFVNYVKLVPGADLKTLKSKMDAFAVAEIHPHTQELEFTYLPFLQAVPDIYLHSSSFRNDVAKRSNFTYIKALIGVGIFLLLIACINFINLTTAKAVKRAKEVGIRKTSGAMASQLRTQFIGEALLLVSFSMLIAIGLAIVLLPQVNIFSGKEISIWNYFNLTSVLTLLGLTLIIGVLAGTYPALVLSSFRPIDVLKLSGLKPGSHVAWLRKGLVVVQFSLSILLIISVLIVNQQVNYLSNKDLGFNKEQLIHFPMKGPVFQNIDGAKEEFLRIPEVSAISACFGIPGDIIAGDNIIVTQPERRTLSTRMFNVDHDYIRTMGLELVAGRDFSKDYTTDEAQAFIINETALKELDLGKTPEEAIGKRLEWPMWNHSDSLKVGQVIGVVKDFHYESLHEEVSAAVLQIYPSSFWKMVIRLDAKDITQSLGAIESVWDQFNTGFPLDYQFVDSSLEEEYKSERSWNRLLWLATCIAIFIACIGAIGLAAFAAEQRKKEIGIRKVLGASVPGLIGLLSKEFLILIVLALIIASPLTWYFMQQWLDTFAYRIPIHWWIFPLAGFSAVLIGLLTISSQGLRAALGNPISSLRDE